MRSGVELRFHDLLKRFRSFFFPRFPLFSRKPNGVFLNSNFDQVFGIGSVCHIFVFLALFLMGLLVLVVDLQMLKSSTSNAIPVRVSTSPLLFD